MSESELKRTRSIPVTRHDRQRRTVQNHKTSVDKNSMFYWTYCLYKKIIYVKFTNRMVCICKINTTTLIHI